MRPTEDHGVVPADVPAVVGRGIRLVGVAAAALTVTAVTAGSTTRGVVHPGPLAAVAGGLLLGGLLLRGRSRVVGATAVVAGAALGVLAARTWLGIEADGLDAFLVVSGAAVVALGLVLDDRRLATLGALQWVVALATPPAGAAGFRHCLVATDLVVPVPALDGPLLLGVGLLSAGSVQRWWGLRPVAGRGIEVTGLLLVTGGLLAKGVELPGLELLCGSGRATDPGWLALALAVGILAAAYGAATGDLTWAATGAATVVLVGLVGTTLDGRPWWALAGLVPVAAVLAWAHRSGIDPPTGPGYRDVRPFGGRSRGPRARLRAERRT